MTARANYLLATADLFPADAAIAPPVFLADAIFDGVDGGGGRFEYVVGNPPWIAWDNLPEPYRLATRPLWERYGLFSLSAYAARHGGAKKDLSMLVLYRAADRFLAAGGRLGMVITQTLFQSKGAGDGFRRFRLGSEGEPLRVDRVDDMVAIKPFPGAANWTSYDRLDEGIADGVSGSLRRLDARAGGGPPEQRRATARPIDPQTGPALRGRFGRRESTPPIFPPDRPITPPTSAPTAAGPTRSTGSNCSAGRATP